MLPILWIIFVLFVFVLYTLSCQFSGLFLFCFSSSCIPYVANSLDCFCFVCPRLVYPILPILWVVFVLFIFVLYTLCCQFSGLFVYLENWQHRVYKTKKNKTKTIQRIGNIGYTRRRKTKQK
jgi:hypothetical protein